jgi:hypothetical protein
MPNPWSGTRFPDVRRPRGAEPTGVASEQAIPRGEGDWMARRLEALHFKGSLTRAVLAVTATAIMAVGSAARAGDVSFDKVPANYVAMMKMKPMDVMHLMDPDKKGYVTKEDFMKFHEMMFEKMDKNHDGKLTESEFRETKGP